MYFVQCSGYPQIKVQYINQKHLDAYKERKKLSKDWKRKAAWSKNSIMPQDLENPLKQIILEKNIFYGIDTLNNVLKFAIDEEAQKIILLRLIIFKPEHVYVREPLILSKVYDKEIFLFVSKHKITTVDMKNRCYYQDRLASNYKICMSTTLMGSGHLLIINQLKSTLEYFTI